MLCHLNGGLLGTKAESLNVGHHLLKAGRTIAVTGSLVELPVGLGRVPSIFIQNVPTYTTLNTHSMKTFIKPENEKVIWQV